MNRFNAGFWKVLAVVCFLFGHMPPARAAVYADIYNFAGGSSDGTSPRGSLIQVGSLLYGLTNEGGKGAGTIFSLNPATNQESLLYSFGNLPDGGAPTGSFIASGSNLYGMTSGGGTLNFGTVFSFNTTNNSETPLYSFLGYSNYNDGANPQGSLIQSGTSLYGLTSEGGSLNGGTIFAIDTVTHAETERYSFMRAPNDGGFPTGTLIQSGTTFYGLTQAGGKNGIGAIFDFNTSTETEGLRYSFSGGTTDGANPYASLLQVGPMLYGTTSQGGTNGDGTIFAYNTQTGIESLLYSFGANANDGTDPRGSLILVGDTLYGTTENGGGSLNDGTIFSYDLSTNSESILHSFQGTDGSNPTGDLLAVGDTLYGLASNGGSHGDGVIFSAAIPEPATATLLFAAGSCLLARRPRRRRLG
jgi:uncharacterized repeat protein (TIGR03803 family)